VDRGLQRRALSQNTYINKYFHTVLFVIHWKGYIYLPTKLSLLLTDAGDCWPLSDEQLSIINANAEKLNELLDTDRDLIGDMRETECLTRRQIDHLVELPYERGRNSKLLDMMIRRSVSDFNKFIECLENNQRHLVPFLTGDEGNCLLQY